MSSLGLIAIARNEGHILDQFFKHYIWQGVDHFYIGDNASNDNSHEIYEKYKDIVTLIHFPEVYNVTTFNENGWFQYGAYGALKAIAKTDWVYVCDLDEFAYARRGFKNIKEFLDAEKEIDFDQFLIRMKYFNSNGHVSQPESVVHGFTKRRISPVEPVKPIVRTSKISKLAITHSNLIHGAVTVDSTLKNSFISEERILPMDKVNKFKLIEADSYENSYIISNHYFAQSYEYYFNNKALRGRASFVAERLSVPDWYLKHWNNIHNITCVDDFELSNLYKEHNIG